MSRIFLSHSSKNNAEALALRDWLASQGWHDVFLDIDPERGLVAADRWQKALNGAIGRCRAVIFLLSPEWRASDHCISELDLAMHAGAERIGVIVKDIPFETIPVGLGGENQMINLTRGGTPVSFEVNPPPDRKPVTITFPEEDLRALRNGLAKLGLVGFETESFPWPPEGEPDRAPYRGLEALDVQDAGVFFGRDSDLVRAREDTCIRLRRKGARASSLSSRAPPARASPLSCAPACCRAWNAKIATSLSCHLHGLRRRRSRAAPDWPRRWRLLSKTLASPRAEGDLITALETDPAALPPLLNRLQVLAMQRLVGDAAAQVDRPPTLVLPVDQAEELFANDAGDEAAAMRRHLAAALTRGPDTIGLLTIRSDRFALLQNDADLKTLLEPFNLPPVSAAVYREAILKPAARANPPIVVDERLAEALINDTAAEGADPLPLLAFTLERLYRRYGRSLHKIDLEHYEALGGLTGSIDAAITEAFAEPSKAAGHPGRSQGPGAAAGSGLHSGAGRHQSDQRRAAEPYCARTRDPGRGTQSRGPPCRCALAGQRQAEDAEGEAPKEDDSPRRARGAVAALELVAGRARPASSRTSSTIGIVESQAKAWDGAEASAISAWLDLRGERLKEALALAGRADFKAVRRAAGGLSRCLPQA